MLWTTISHCSNITVILVENCTDQTEYWLAWLSDGYIVLVMVTGNYFGLFGLQFEHLLADSGRTGPDLGRLPEPTEISVG